MSLLHAMKIRESTTKIWRYKMVRKIVLHSLGVISLLSNCFSSEYAEEKEMYNHLRLSSHMIYYKNEINDDGRVFSQNFKSKEERDVLNYLKQSAIFIPKKEIDYMDNIT